MDSSSRESQAHNGPIHEGGAREKRRRFARSSVPMMPVALLLSSQPVVSARNLALVNKNPFLPDYIGNLCKNDKPADSWMTAVPTTAEACCKLHFSWNLATCQANSKKWALENAPETVEKSEEEVDTSTKYWADTTAGICKLDGPDRPSWATAYEISFQECCDKYLSWSYDKCMAYAPKEDEMVQNSSSTEKKYYPDSIKGYCKEDGPSRPSWATTLEDDYTICCENHFNKSDETLFNCMKKMPNSASKKPTVNPTKSPVSSAPVKALYFTPSPEASSPTTSPPTTLRPTSLPTSNVICSDQSLSKSQCESNPKCIWYLKKGIACTYKAWVMPTAKPTPRPTRSPVISYEFYNIPSSGLCAFNDESKPAWITKIYSDWDECCEEESWDVPKCLAAKPDELKQNDMVMNAPTGGGSGSEDYVIIDVTMYGSLMLDKLILPSVTSDEWNDLKRVLTKSLILTLAYNASLVHPNVEVELWSVGTQQFTWRRLIADDIEEVEPGSTSSLRGAQGERRARKNKKTKKPSSQPSSQPVAQSNDMVQNSQSLASKYELKFAVVVPTKCGTDCQSSSGYLGEDEAGLIEAHLQEYVKNNYFGVQLKREGNAMGLFFDSLPKASNVKLRYQFAAKAGGGLTWTPSASPTLKPTLSPTTSPTITASPSSSSKPISRTYYPDYENHICKVADGSEPEFEVNFFPSLKKCCKFEWIDYQTCMQLSFTDHPTPRPTGTPTIKPTKGPKTKRPSSKPTVKTSPAPTKRPIQLNSSPITLGGVVYYPDLILGVCKSDGKHGNIPYKFSTAEACCDNNLMDYVKCMMYAKPKKYYPNPWAGYCQEVDGSENSMYSYSLQECCESGLVGEYDSCITNTLNQSGPGPTTNPTRSPITSSLPGVYYPDFAAGFCRSDGFHGDKPYVFASAEKCCRNAVMNYDDCVRESINRFEQAPPTTPEPTHKPTTPPTPKPSIKPTKHPTPLPTKLQVASALGNYYPDFTAGYCKSDGLHIGKPYVFTTAEKCCSNEVMDYYSCLIVSIERFNEAPPATSTTTTTTTTTTTSLPSIIYYPDIALKVCKSDGNHGDSPYSYSDARSCCENFSTDYERCMAYNAGYEYIPITWEGYCRVSSGTELIAYKYDSLEDCCESTQSNTYSSCLMLSLEGLGGTSGTVSSSTTTTTSTSAASKVYYPDLVLKVCKSDGKQGTIPYLFNTAHACCDNNYMNYDTCMAYAQGNTGVLQTTTTTTTTTTVQASKIYYPDLVLKVCKSDGKQGQIPFLFNSAHECCDNNLMDYDSCMAYANNPSPITGPVPVVTPAPITPRPNPKPIAGSTPAPITPQPSPEPTLGSTPKPTVKPTLKPTEKYTTPPVVVAAIDGRKIIGEVTDSFEKGLTGVFPWSTSPENPWTIDTSSFKDGSASARSAPISKGETSDLYVAVNTDHGGMFYFSLKTDVQMPYSGFYVNIDDKSKMGYTFAFSEYKDLSVSVDAGQHVLMFRTWVPSNAHGTSPTSSGTVNVDKVSFQPILVEDFESQELAWESARFVGPDWQFDTSNPHAGDISLRTPNLLSGQSSSMSFEFTISSKGSVVEFWYDSNISGEDKFEFLIDGYAVFSVTTDSGNWKMQSKSLVPGKHTLEWKFIKSGGANSSVWIDDIRIRPIGI